MKPFLFFMLMAFLMACESADDAASDTLHVDTLASEGDEPSLAEEASIDSITFHDFQKADLIFVNYKAPKFAQFGRLFEEDFNQVGIININHKDSAVMVLYMNGGFQSATLDKFLAETAGGRVAIARLKDADNLLTEQKLKEMRINVMRGMKGVRQDFQYSWGDTQMYPAEFVHKLYFLTLGVELCDFKRFGDYDLSNEENTEILRQSYKLEIPKNMEFVRITDIYNSPELNIIHKQ